MIHNLDEFLVDTPPAGWIPAELENPDRHTPIYQPDATIVLPHQRFRITDDSAATWAMRKLRHVKRRQAENVNLADQEYQRIAEWVEAVNAPLHREVAYFEGLLTEYAIRCRQNPEDGRKSISTPAGKVSTRENAPKWSVEADEFLPWAREHRPDLIRVKEEPALSLIKEAFKDGPSVAATGVAITDDGEVVPGIAIAESETTVSVQPDLD